MIDYGFEVFNYNLHLLPALKWMIKIIEEILKRLGLGHDNCWEFMEENNIEAQETVLKTNKLSINDFRYFRFIILYSR